ncbi:MAG TPA: hypothetical protein EYP56_17915 [Planctomycetaceae bacterium]|nr:hypothetical protein [Planctomycetaceae bacterium]HIQ22652.1 hypothetical protein [Planctomycetota bacterium]
MRRHHAIGTRRWTLPGLLAIGFWAVMVTVGRAQLPTIVRVEEDCELVVGQPDPDTNAPQVTVAVSPVGDVSSVYTTLVVNCQSLLSYEPGGYSFRCGRAKCRSRHLCSPRAAS